MRAEEAKRRGRARLWGGVLLLAITGLGVAASGKDKKSAVPPSYAVLVGTVWNAADQPVPGAQIKIRPAGAKKARWELLTNERGEFVQHVPAGEADYVVSARDKAHKKPVEKTIHISQDERLNVGLHFTE
jgi:hypothetical protein